MAQSTIKRTVVWHPFGGWIEPLEGNLGNAALEGDPKRSQYTTSTAISLFRLGRFGHIAPGPGFVAVTDTNSRINQLPLNGVVTSNGKSIVVLKNARIVRTTNDGTSVDTSGTEYADIASPTTSNNADIITIKDLAATPIEYVLWSWEDSTDGDIALVQPDLTTSLDTDWFSTVPSGGGALRKNVPLKMCQGIDGDIYITNGPEIAKISVGTGAISAATADTNFLTLGSDWTAMGICTYGNYIVAIASQNINSGGFTGITRRLCRAFFYDVTDSGTNFSFSYDIQDNFADGIFSDGKELYAVTSGRNNATTLQKFNGAGFDPVFCFGTLFTQSVPIQGNADFQQRSFLFGAGQSLYRYFEKGMHHETLPSTSTFSTSTIGMVRNLYQNQLFIGAANVSSSYKILYSSISLYYTPADFRTALYDMGFKGTITRIRAYFSQFGSGASVTFSLFNNYDTISIGGANDKLNRTVTYATHGAIAEIDINDIAIPDISAWYMNVRFNHNAMTDTAAIIRKIEVDWEPSTI